MNKQYWIFYHPNDKSVIDPRFKVNSGEVTFSAKVTLPKKESVLLCEVDSSNQVVRILKESPFSILIPRSEIEKIEELNSRNKAEKEIKIFTSMYKKPENLIISDFNWALINSTIDLGKYPLLIGPKGSGKTQTAQSIAQVRGMKFFPLNCGAIFKPKQTLIGQMQVKDGNTFLCESEFLKHFTDNSEEGVLIFLDEISRITPAAANYFMTILDRIQSYIYVEEEGRRIYKGKNVIFFAAGNFGFEYTDTRNLDSAFMDRFIKFILDYLSPEEEAQLIKARVPGADLNDINTLVDFAIIFREQSEKLRNAPSTRQLLDLAEYLSLGYDVKIVWDNIMKNLFLNGSVDERETAQKLIDAKF